MKTMELIRESKGLLAFIVVYVLIRLILISPVMAIQDYGTITVSVAALTIAWVMFATMMDERKGMFVALGLLAVSVFIYFSFDVFVLQEAKYAIWAVMACTAVVGLVNFFRILRTDKKVGLMLIIGTAAILVVLFGTEFLIPML